MPIPGIEHQYNSNPSQFPVPKPEPKTSQKQAKNKPKTSQKQAR
jgi:hypothetical protein